MFDLVGLLDRVSKFPGRVRPVLAAPFDLAPSMVDGLVRSGAFSGVLAAAPPQSPAAAKSCVGWWVGRRGSQWRLNRGAYRDVMLLGCTDRYKVSGQMLLEARLNGVQQIHLVDLFGEVIGMLDVGAEILERLNSNPEGLEINYAVAYDALFEVFGDRFRLKRSEIKSGKILMVVGNLGPGGAERQLAYTAAGLAKKHDREVQVACMHLDPPLDFFRNVVENAGAEVTLVNNNLPSFDEPEWIEIRNDLARYWSIGFINVVHVIYHYACLIRDARPEVVHTWMDYCNVLAGIAAHLVGVPTVIVGGRSVGPEHFPVLFQPYMRPGYEALVKRRRVLFLNNSRAGAEDYRRWLDLEPSDFLVVPNGFDFPPFTPGFARDRVRKELGIDPSAFLLGSVMRFSEEKDPYLLLDTFRILHRRYPGMRFVAFGGGAMLEEARQYVKKSGLDEVVQLPGITSDVWPMLDAMDCFILTSRMEGLANVLVEAQAAGLPVVCTGVGGMPETYLDGETGFSPSVRTADALADLVAALVEDPEWRTRISTRAGAFSRASFSVDALIANTLDAYDQAARRQHSDNLPAVG